MVQAPNALEFSFQKYCLKNAFDYKEGEETEITKMH